VRVPHLSPITLTTDEQRLILRATADNVRDHVTYFLALGTGLRLAEIVGLDVGDVFGPDGTPRVTNEKVNALKRFVSAGTPKAAIARQLEVSESTVYRVVRGVARQNSIRVDSERLARAEPYRESRPVASLSPLPHPFIVVRCSPESPSSWVGSDVSARRGLTF